MNQTFNVLTAAALNNGFTVANLPTGCDYPNVGCASRWDFPEVTTFTKAAIKATIEVEWDDDGNVTYAFERNAGGSGGIGKRVLPDGRVCEAGIGRSSALLGGSADLTLAAIILVWITNADRYYEIASDPMFVGG